MHDPAAESGSGPRWKDFQDSERWKVAVGVWWRIIVLSVGLWLAASLIVVVLALIVFALGGE